MKKTNYANLFKMSFISGTGTFLGVVPQLFVGIVLFLGGVYLKEKADSDGVQDVRFYGGLGLMVLGSALGLGFGAGTLIGEVTE